jgi:hypothetical protein
MDRVTRRFYPLWRALARRIISRPANRFGSQGEATVGRILQILVISAIVICVRASAHHSFAAYYFEDRTISMTGEVVEFEYRNPHSWVHLIAASDNGQTQRVSAEWASVSRLRQFGVMPNTLKPGDRVVITGSPSRTPEDGRMHLKSIQRPADGWAWSGRRSP